MTYKTPAILVHGKTLSDCSHAANSYPCSQTKHSWLTLCTSPFSNTKGEERPANEEIQEHRLCQKTRLIKALREGSSTRTTKYHRRLQPQSLKLLIASRWQGYQGFTKDSKNNLTNSQESLLEAIKHRTHLHWRAHPRRKHHQYSWFMLCGHCQKPVRSQSISARLIYPQINFFLLSTRP